MDKETLSNYGWIVVCVMVLAVMIALATPFGTFIKSGVENTTQGLFDTKQSAFEAAGIDIADQSFEPSPEELIAQGIVPESCTYIIPGFDGICDLCYYDIITNPENLSNCYCGNHSSDETIRNEVIYNAGDTMPATVNDGDIFIYGDYKYTYKTSYNGWGVRVLDDTKTEYGAILESINGEPITSMGSTFSGCTALTTAPTIPNGVTSMSHTFWKCTSLKTYVGSTDADGDFSNYVIPNSVTESMVQTFSGCTALTTAPAIPSSATSMQATFENCSSLVNVPTIPNSVTGMNSTFKGCTSLTDLSDFVIPNSVTDMTSTFNGCTALETAPVIPNSVTSMSSTFYGCTSLETAPAIPSSVTTMWYTFQGCTSLTGNIEINANPTGYSWCFNNTSKPITLSGSSPILAKIAAGYSNVTVAQ